MFSSHSLEGVTFQCCQHQAPIESHKAKTFPRFSRLTKMKNRHGESKELTKNNRRGESKSNMNTRTVPPTLQDSALFIKFPENDIWYCAIWWKAFTSIFYFCAIYMSFVTAYHPESRKQSLANLLHGFTMSVVVILANNSAALAWILSIDACAFFTAATVNLNFSWKHTVFLFYCHHLEVFIGAMGYRRWANEKLEENLLYPTSLHGMIGFWLFPVCLAPTTVALFGAGAYHIFIGLDFSDTLKSWWMSDLLGTYISFWLCMVLLTVTESEVYSLFSKEKKLSTLVVLAEVVLQAGFIYIISYPNGNILTILCLPMLSFIAWRHHIAVSTLLQMYAMLLVTVLFDRKYTIPTRMEITAFYITVWVTLCVSSLIAVSC